MGVATLCHFADLTGVERSEMYLEGGNLFRNVKMHLEISMYIVQIRKFINEIKGTLSLD